MLQKILLAIGDSSGSAQILELGFTLAEKMSAEVLILHILDPLVPHGLSKVGSPLVRGILPMIDDSAIAQYTQAWNQPNLKLDRSPISLENINEE